MNKTVVALSYHGAARQLHTQFKFHQHYPSGSILSYQLAKKIQENYCNKKLPDIIIPTPIHDQRLRERGFNQSLYISQYLSDFFQLPINTNILTRIKHTPAQSQVKAKHRQKNVQGAFKALKHAYQDIAIIDDVITTGSTIREICQTVRGEQTINVHVWACCKTRPARE